MADELTNDKQNQTETPETQASEPAPPQPAAVPEAPAPSAAEPPPPPAAESPAAAAPEATVAAAATGEAVPARRGRSEPRDRHSRGPAKRGGRGHRPDRSFSAEPGEIEDTVVKIYRCATVVRGGRRFSFSALVVAGDHDGRVGVGYGKANEVPSAVEKGGKIARRCLVEIQLDGTTIPHKVLGRYGASKVLLIPAGEGTGVIAGASVRAVMELAGVKDVLTKSYGSNSPKNLVKAAFAGLRALRSKEQIGKLREVSIP